MKSVSGRVFYRALERAGWTLVRVSGSHHINEQASRPWHLSVPVHGNKDLAPGLLRRLLKDAELSEGDL